MNSLSPWVRKFVAVGLLVCALASILSIFVLPLRRWSASAVESLHDVRFELRRASQTLEASKDASAERNAAIEQQIATQLALGGNEAEAVTQIQALLDRLLKEQGLTLESSQAANPQPTGVLTRLGVDVRASGTEEKVMHFLASVEQAAPILRIERLTLRGMSGATAERPNVAPLVVLDATISAYWRSRLAGGGQ